ncbi:MAG: nucleoside hydrolase [Lachnospiraceae bacterium]
MEKILLDTDIGGDIDDAICLAYLLKEPRCELMGITTVCGEPEKRAAVADAICRAAGKQVPIVAGLDTTMQPVPIYPTPDGAAALKYWEHSTYEKGDAPGFLYQKIKEYPHEIVLIGIGNMTNIATLFTVHPDAAGLLKGLYVMNGYFGEDALPDPYYNWNSWADPMASKIVFSSLVPIHRVMPLEVTDRLTVEAKRAEVLFRTDSDLMKAVFSFGNAWLEHSEKLTLHDPLAAVSVFYPEICRFERGNVRVETKLERNMGGTAFVPSKKGNVEIARTVDRGRFYRILSDTICGGF